MQTLINRVFVTQYRLYRDGVLLYLAWDACGFKNFQNVLKTQLSWHAVAFNTFM